MAELPTDVKRLLSLVAGMGPPAIGGRGELDRRVGEPVRQDATGLAFEDRHQRLRERCVLGIHLERHRELTRQALGNPGPCR